jgi:tetratricopeptide (TPR) repeat protein
LRHGTRSDNRFPALGILLTAALTLLANGCRDKPAEGALDAALAPIRGLPAEQQEPALRRALADGSVEARIVWYELGNLAYQAAAAADAPPPGPDSPTGRSATLDSALAYFQRASALDTLFVEPLVNAGLIWDDVAEGRDVIARNALASARECYQHAIRLRPDDEKARCNLGSLNFRRHQYTEAIEQFNAVLARNPRSALAHYNLAIMFAESKLYREAIREWEAAAKHDRDGDIGERSRQNIKVIQDLMKAEVPAGVAAPSHS